MKSYLIVFSIFIVFLAVIFWNFPNRIIYGPEQGISLLSSASNLEKPSLLGIPYLLRQTDSGLRIFTSPIFGYLILPIILISKFDPISITYFFGLLTVLTGVVLFLVTKKMFNSQVATIATFLYLFNSRIIYHSFFVWTSNLMPLVGIFTLYLFYKFTKSNQNKNINKYINLFLLGLVLGFGLGIQYFFALAVVLVVVFVFTYSKEKVKDMLFLTLGGVASELPTILFDLKHDFYNTRTLWSYFLSIFTQRGESQISYYHFLFLYPVIFIFLGLIIYFIYKKQKLIGLMILAFYLVINLTSKLINFNKPVGMPDGLIASDLIAASRLISNEEKGNSSFNVSVTGNFDNRGYSLRFPLQYSYGLKPESVESYQSAKTLYVLAYLGYNFDKPDIWEVSVFGKPKEIKAIKLNDSWNVYKLTK